MKIQAINNINKSNTTNKINNYKNQANPNSTVTTANYSYSNGAYGKAQVGLSKKSNPSFGVFSELIIPALEGIGFGAACTAVFAALGGAFYWISSIPAGKREKEAQRLFQIKMDNINKIEKELNVDVVAAIKYHDDFLNNAYIEPTNDGNEIGLNAVLGYGVEKYKIAMDFVVPILTKKKELTYPKMPNGMLLYGPPGGGKTYMAEKTCEHLKHFGVNIIPVEFQERGHAKNAERIKKAFEDGKEYFKRTGKPSVIYFPQDIDNYLLDRKKTPEYIKEVRAFINSSENCADEGVSWIGTANYSQNIDSAILRPGRTDIKLAIGEMEDFAIGDMIKYVLFKLDEKDSAAEFDYQKVINKIKDDNIAFTPAEIELFVTDAKRHNPYPENFVTAELVIDEIDNYILKSGPTLTPEVMESFRKDQEYIKNIDEQALAEAQEKVKKAADKREKLAAIAKKANEAVKEANDDLTKAQKEEILARQNEYTIDVAVAKQKNKPKK